MELNRFKQLLESTMGNVKPLISEQSSFDLTKHSNLKEIGNELYFNIKLVNKISQSDNINTVRIF